MLLLRGMKSEFLHGLDFSLSVPQLGSVKHQPALTGHVFSAGSGSAAGSRACYRARGAPRQRERSGQNERSPVQFKKNVFMF